MIINLHSVVCIYIWLYVEYHNCSLYAMSTIAYKRPPLLLMCFLLTLNKELDRNSVVYEVR